MVTEDEALRAMALAFLRLKIVIEPGGAVALAAALFHGDKLDGEAVIAVASGGNVDPAVFRMALDRLRGTRFVWVAHNLAPHDGGSLDSPATREAFLRLVLAHEVGLQRHIGATAEGA